MFGETFQRIHHVLVRRTAVRSFEHEVVAGIILTSPLYAFYQRFRIAHKYHLSVVEIFKRHLFVAFSASAL